MNKRWVGCGGKEERNQVVLSFKEDAIGPRESQAWNVKGKSHFHFFLTFTFNCAVLLTESHFSFQLSSSVWLNLQARPARPHVDWATATATESISSSRCSFSFDSNRIVPNHFRLSSTSIQRFIKINFCQPTFQSLLDPITLSKAFLKRSIQNLQCLQILISSSTSFETCSNLRIKRVPFRFTRWTIRRTWALDHKISRENG